MSAAGARAHFADELRGFALLGIVLVNAPFLGISSEGYTAASVATGVDRAAAFAVIAFAQAKFYLLFSFLFGYSLSFLLDGNDATQRARYRRRLLGLALLGAVHAVFAFIGDILVLYAVLGTAMLVLVRWPDRRLLIAAGCVGASWLLLLLALALVALSCDGGESVAGHWRALDTALAHGTFFEAAAARLAAWPEAALFIATLNGGAVLALFAVGLVAGRHRMLAEPERFTRLWTWGRWLGWGIGAPLAVLAAWWMVGPGADVGSGQGRELLGVSLCFASAPLLSWGYVATLASLHQRATQPLRMFRPAGRMSLTGYLGESILLSLLFCGYGLGLYGALGAAWTLVAGVAVWGLLDVFSHAWLRRFRQGPFELLLRRMSHGRAAPAR